MNNALRVALINAFVILPIGSFFVISRKMGKEMAAAINRELLGEGKGGFKTMEIPAHFVSILRDRFLAREQDLAKGGVVAGREVGISAVRSVYWVTGGKVSCSVLYAFHGIAENQEPFSYKLKAQRLEIRYAQNKQHGNWIVNAARWLP